MDRTKEHFEERLTKDEYSKEEVAKMLYNEADFTASKTRGEFKDYVPKSEFDTLSTELETARSELKPYKDQEFNNTVGTEFTKLNGSSDRLEDFKSIAKLSGSETSEEILAKATEMKNTGKYDFLFKQGNSTPPGTIHGGQQKRVGVKNIIPQSGIISSLFGKKDK